MQIKQVCIMKHFFSTTLFICIGSAEMFSQQKTNDVTTPLHLMKPDYPIPYGAPSKETVKTVLDRVFNYLDAVTPAQMINKQTNEVVNEVDKLDTNTIVKPGDF